VPSKNDPIIAEFKRLVNMSAPSLERRLATENSLDAEATQQIVELLKKNASLYTDADLHRMHAIVGNIKKLLAHRPKGEPEHARWTHNLRNLGHDTDR
jgi:hypothetical protein